MASDKKQIVELGSVRGLASVVVIFSHALFFYKNPHWFTNAAQIFNGRAAVMVFFVLSGYVLTRSLGPGEVTTGSLFGFYVKRVFRIYPAIWAASILALVYLTFINFNVH